MRRLLLSRNDLGIRIASLIVDLAGILHESNRVHSPAPSRNKTDPAGSIRNCRAHWLESIRVPFYLYLFLIELE